MWRSIRRRGRALVLCCCVGLSSVGASPAQSTAGTFEALNEMLNSIEQEALRLKEESTAQLGLLTRLSAELVRYRAELTVLSDSSERCAKRSEFYKIAFWVMTGLFVATASVAIFR